MASSLEDRLAKLERSVGFQGNASTLDLSSRLDAVAKILDDTIKREAVLKQQLEIGKIRDQLETH